MPAAPLILDRPPRLKPRDPPPLDGKHLAYFTAQLSETRHWEARMGIRLADICAPGVSVLDFGCGHGALSVAAAGRGASVIGVDTGRARIAFARENAARHYAEIADRLSFFCGRADALAGRACIDAIVSKDTFEHVTDIDSVLFAFRRLLRPGGRAFLGFSPLWFSPFGDHGFLTRRRLPWRHLFVGEAQFVAAHNRHTGRSDGSVAETGFNRLRPVDFRAAFARHGFMVEALRINPCSPAKRLGMLPLDVARRVPGLEKFATIGMYVTLRAASSRL